MIVTVTLNPTLDRTLAVAQLVPGTVHRAELLRQDLGGKGINVSRALRALGIPSRIVGLFGGATGEVFRLGLAAEGFEEVRFLRVRGDTRQNITLFDRARNEYTKFNEAGPSLDAAAMAACEDEIEQTALPGDVWAFCGSLPPGAPDDWYARLIAKVQARGARAVLDTSGTALRAGVAACPFALKINVEEAGELLGRALNDEAALRTAVLELRALGIEIVALTRGAQGAVLGVNEALVFAVPPPILARSPVGAGDAATAGLLWSVSEGCDAGEMARRMVACGTATAMQEGTAVGERVLIQTLMPQVRIVRAVEQ